MNKLVSQINEKVQTFRGLAIIAVVIIHTLPPRELQVFCRPFVNFAVAIFLFLSGYLTRDIYDGWNNICKKRIFRVLIPYIIWSLIYCLPLIGDGYYMNFLLRLVTAKTCFPFYYIFVYIQFVIITPIIFRLIKSKYYFLGWWIAPVYIFISIYIPRFASIEENEYFNIINRDLCLGWLSFYYLGLMLSNNNIKGVIIRNLAGVKRTSLKWQSSKEPISNEALLYIYIVTLILQMIEINFWNKYGVVNCGSQLNMTSIISSILFCFLAYRVITGKLSIEMPVFLIYIGNYSFGIYMSHVFIINLLSNANIFNYNAIPFLIKSVLVLVCSFIFCFLISHIVGVKYSKILGLK